MPVTRDDMYEFATECAASAGRWERAAIFAAAEEASSFVDPMALAHVVRGANQPGRWCAVGEGYDRTESGCVNAARRAVTAEATRLGIARR